jgi:hypothetical protein
MTQERVAQVTRFYAKHSDGSPDTTIWIDVLQFQKNFFQANPAIYSAAKGAQPMSWPFGDDPTQGSWLVTHWADRSGNAPNPAVTFETRKVLNPQDSSQEVDLEIVSRAPYTTRGAKDGATRGHIWTFNNNPADPGSPDNNGGQPNTRRKGTVVHVVNNDLGGLDMSSGPVDWATYQAAMSAGAKDYTQYVDAEITGKFAVDLRPGNQDAVIALNNDALANLFDASGSGVAGVRTDPLQTIVNVSWGGPPGGSPSHGFGLYYATGSTGIWNIIKSGTLAECIAALPSGVASPTYRAAVGTPLPAPPPPGGVWSAGPFSSAASGPVPAAPPFDPSQSFNWGWAGPGNLPGQVGLDYTYAPTSDPYSKTGLYAQAMNNSWGAFFTYQGYAIIEDGWWPTPI